MAELPELPDEAYDVSKLESDYKYPPSGRLPRLRFSRAVVDKNGGSRKKIFTLDKVTKKPSYVLFGTGPTFMPWGFARARDKNTGELKDDCTVSTGVSNITIDPVTGEFVGFWDKDTTLPSFKDLSDVDKALVLRAHQNTKELYNNIRKFVDKPVEEQCAAYPPQIAGLPPLPGFTAVRCSQESLKPGSKSKQHHTIHAKFLNKLNKDTKKQEYDKDGVPIYAVKYFGTDKKPMTWEEARVRSRGCIYHANMCVASLYFPSQARPSVQIRVNEIQFLKYGTNPDDAREEIPTDLSEFDCDDFFEAAKRAHASGGEGDPSAKRSRFADEEGEEGEEDQAAADEAHRQLTEEQLALM